MASRPKYPGIRVTTNGNTLVSYYTEARLSDAGIFYPITPSTEMGENYQLAWAEGRLNVFGRPKLAIEAEGEHAAQGGAIACSVTGKRVVNFTSGQGLLYGLEQYHHAPGKLSTMVVEVAARALTKHALNVHCGHDDVYAALDAGWIVLFARDAQQAADQAIILRRVTELSLTPGINAQDGFLTSHLERTFVYAEADLIREFLGAPDDLIDCPTPAQRALFGPKRRRVPALIDLANPVLLGPVQNQEHYMNGVVARRDNFAEHIPGFLSEAYEEFARLTGRRYGFLTEHRAEGAETVFVSIGSAAENIEAAVDLLAARGERVGSIHVNVLRPFPEEAVARALAGKKRVIVLERADDHLAGDNALGRDIRTALSKQAENGPAAGALSPLIFTGVYGLGSRDFRPEGILGAYEYALGRIARQDGRRAADGVRRFCVGVDHATAVVSKERPSLLPGGSIAVRLHSIGGWGMITTGKNLGAIIGDLGDFVAKRQNALDEWGRLKEVIHVSANPRYGSEKKGAPTAYYLVVAPERVRVNCDLRHVDIVLCCDPKAFTHMNPLDGMAEGGALVWESDATPDLAWQRIPARHRRTIIEKKIRLYTLPGFEIARRFAGREDLQMRMQGNAFLGAFFRASPFLKTFSIERAHFEEVVRAQYKKKFGRQGDQVVAANMDVMLQGFEQLREVPHGPVDAPDRASMRGEALAPLQVGAEADRGVEVAAGPCAAAAAPCQWRQPFRQPLFQRETFDREFRAGLGYDQPASALASVGLMAAATGAQSSKFVARLSTPVFVAENCTQCMECIAACPDTALPNTAQELGTVLKTAVDGYVRDPDHRRRLHAALPAVESRLRARMLAEVAAKRGAPIAALAREEMARADLPPAACEQVAAVLDLLPLAYAKTHAVFSAVEKKRPGGGGVFGIFVSDLCKGCGECVERCGEHEALRMEPETAELNARHVSARRFLDLLPETSPRYLGLYDHEKPEESRTAALRNHLMVRRNYEALLSGDGACAGCGEKSVLHALASVTEAYMRPIFHAKAARLDALAARLEADGGRRLAELRRARPQEHALLARAVAHLVLGLGGEDDEDTSARLARAGAGAIDDGRIVAALTQALRQDAFAHRDLRAVDGRLENGMAVMAMGACTGCNTVFGSTPPANPHPYPWMNSLFQDGATVAWMFGESFIADHARRSVIPERLAGALLDGRAGGGGVITKDDYFDLAHFTDALMTAREVRELPKAWGVGGDGGMGDIGYQNVSKVVLQNRPNVKVLLLDTQVYSNT
ncbi:MAG: 2-oxoacid:acceptor oxidoreductase family protein, partial [Planctomycetes bacterium]|nr:2-oxoacid:acceptor oxidoreductase family protein [Planctomycetota bacterium]